VFAALYFLSRLWVFPDPFRVNDNIILASCWFIVAVVWFIWWRIERKKVLRKPIQNRMENN
jgi:hypothetical protein